MKLQKHLGQHKGGVRRKQRLHKKAAGPLDQLSGKA